MLLNAYIYMFTFVGRFYFFFFFSSRRRHTRYWRDWSSDVCSSDLEARHLHALAFDVLEERRVALGDAFAGDLLAVLPGLVRGLAKKGLVLLRERKIGRASCRERV